MMLKVHKKTTTDIIKIYLQKLLGLHILLLCYIRSQKLGSISLHWANDILEVAQWEMKYPIIVIYNVFKAMSHDRLYMLVS